MVAIAPHGPRHRRQPRAALSLVVAGIVATLMSAVPILYLVRRGAEAGWERIIEILGRAEVVELTGRSLALSAAVGLVAGTVGTATAWLCECTSLRFRTWWIAAIVAPMAIPSYVTAYAWVSLSPTMASIGGAVLVLSGVTIPLVHLHVSATIRRIDPALEEVASSLGWSPSRVTLRLLVPQMRRGIASGVLLTMLYVLADFGAVATMRLPVFTWVIHGAYKASFDPNRAAVLATVLCLVAVVLVMLERTVRGRATSARLGSGSVRPRALTSLGRWEPLAHLGLAAIASLSVGFPLLRSLHWVVAGSSNVELAEFLPALGSTAALGAAVALATVSLAIPLAWLAARHSSPSVLAAERSVLVIHSLPGIVVALSFVYLGTRVLLPIYQEWPIVVLGLSSLLLALAVGVLRTAFEQQSISLIHAAGAAGLGEVPTLLRVGLPLALPAIGASLATIALHTAKELPMTLLLRPSGADTLATRLWTWAGIADDGSVGPYALSLIALAVPPTVLMAISDRRRISSQRLAPAEAVQR